MEENKRLFQVLGFLVLIIVVACLIVFWPKSDSKFICKIKADKDYSYLGEMDYDKYKCVLKNKNASAIVYTDKLTSKKKGELNKAAKKVSHPVYYLSSDISKSDLNKIKKDLKYNDNSFDKDVLLVIKNGKVKDYKEDILSDNSKIYDFLNSTDLAKFAFGIKAEDGYENLGSVNYEDYEKLYNSDEPFVLIVAQTTCSWCEKFRPIINDYAGKHGLRVYIMEIDKLSSDESQSFESSLDYFKDNNNWGTPLTLGIKDKKVVANLSGYTDDEDALAKFFDEAGIK